MNLNNRSKTLSVYPEVTEISYASNIKTYNLNKMLKSIEESAMRAIIRGRDISTELSRIQEGVIKSYLAIASKYGQLNYVQGNYAYATAYDIITNLSSTGKILYDSSYGYVTLNPISSYSKIPKGEKYDGKISPLVDFYLDNVLQAKDTTAYDALDGSSKTFWMATVADGEHVIRLDLPPSLTKRFNYIELYPFPLYGMKIKKIEYVDYHSKKYDVTKDIYGTNPLQNNTGEPLKLYLAPKEYNGTIYITIEPTTLNVVGFSNIDIKFVDFNNTTQSGYLKFDTFGSKIKPYNMTISNVIIDFYFDGPTAQSMITGAKSPITCKLLQGTESNGEITAGSWSHQINLTDASTMNLNNVEITLLDNENIYLYFELTEHNTTTPVLRGAKLKYTEI